MPRSIGVLVVVVAFLVLAAVGFTTGSLEAINKDNIEHIQRTHVHEDLYLIGDSITRYLYGAVDGLLSGNNGGESLGLDEKYKQRTRNDFDLIDVPHVPGLHVGYRFVDFAHNLTQQLAHIMGAEEGSACGDCLMDPFGGAHPKAVTKDGTSDDNNNNKHYNNQYKFVVVSVGLWDVLYYKDADIERDIATIKRTLERCLHTSGLCRPHQTQQQQQQHTQVRIVWRALTPVVESLLPPRKATMTNARITHFNNLLRAAFPSLSSILNTHTQPQHTTQHEPNCGTAVAYDTPVFFYDAHLKFYTNPSSSSDGVHYNEHVTIADALSTLADLSTLRVCDGLRFHQRRNQDSEHAQTESSTPTTTDTTTNTIPSTTTQPAKPKAVDSGANSERLPPCHEVGCLSVQQVALVMNFSVAIAALLVIKTVKWSKPSLLAASNNTLAQSDSAPSARSTPATGKFNEYLRKVASREHVLQQWVILGFILLLMWLVDGPNKVLLGHQQKVYDRDFFFFVCAVIGIVAFMFIDNNAPPPRPSAPRTTPNTPSGGESASGSVEKGSDVESGSRSGSEVKIAATQEVVLGSSEILNRQQTEEWKGWMQIMFLLYHYYNAKEIYNSIRLFIACYVWMTGYGHVFYCTGRKNPDLGVVRLSKMMFRLNFLVLLMCATMQNEYMLYYICALHTMIFLLTYLSMLVFPSYNQVPWVVPVKIVCLLVLSYLLWDFDDGVVFYTIFGPFINVLGLNGSLYEFYFRTNLDHYVWIWGMACAYFYPYVERFIVKIETQQTLTQQIAWKALILGAAGSVTVWYTQDYLLDPDRFHYNTVHPYTSFIPITLYVIFRNISPRLRSKHLSLLSWMGRSTLETYLLQFHLFLTSASKTQVVYLSDSYPALNFLAASCVFVSLSAVTFNVTSTISDWAIPPSHTPRDLARRAVTVACVWVALCGAAWLVQGACVTVPLDAFVCGVAALAAVPVLFAAWHTDAFASLFAGEQQRRGG
eukprot:TRINITY_DN1551_c1_g1_i1.p1 TRINITY_DN1551_c1_g1~~TRINITY_DN1551_c1_g1_i1.p1  ORF type:complete len:990 (-),score=199.24 TRINITY_DN1551_c1_g1_i1:53-3022(-)